MLALLLAFAAAAALPHATAWPAAPGNLAGPHMGPDSFRALGAAAAPDTVPYAGLATPHGLQSLPAAPAHMLHMRALSRAPRPAEALMLARGSARAFGLSLCGLTSGCGCRWNGYCWRGCGDDSWSEDRRHGKWCYTTRGERGSKEWETCEDGHDCGVLWECGGRCFYF